MSSLIVEVCSIEELRPHANADRLEIAKIKGWECVVGKNQFKMGDKCVYIPPDSILPAAISDKLGVTKYLSPVKDDNGVLVGGRVRVSRLRSHPSYGLVTSVDILPSKRGPNQIGLVEWKVGDDVAPALGITKWEPPLCCSDGDAEREHPAFHRYFTLENINNFP